MKNTKIIYWILTGLFAAMMLGSAIPDILVMPVAVTGFKEMGMPPYLIPFLGIAKLLGVIAILVPGFPRIKEWAYAGLMYDVIGAIYSVASSGKPAGTWMPMFILVILAAGSYIYYHKMRKAVSSQHAAVRAENGRASGLPGKQAVSPITGLR